MFNFEKFTKSAQNTILLVQLLYEMCQVKLVKKSEGNEINEINTEDISETMDNVKATTDNLNQITAKINGKDSSLGMLLNDKGLYNHIDSTVCSLDSILIDLKANPKKYVQFKLF